MQCLGHIVFIPFTTPSGPCADADAVFASVLYRNKLASLNFTVRVIVDAYEQFTLTPEPMSER